MLWGLCAVTERHIVTLEGHDTMRSLCLYAVNRGELQLLDKHLNLVSAYNPRVDTQGTIYVPYHRGVAVIRLLGETHLVFTKTLSSGGTLESAKSVAIETINTMWVTVGGEKNRGVYQLDIASDLVISNLRPGPELEVRSPWGIAVQSGSVLVGYNYSKTLALYLMDTESPMLVKPEGLVSVRGITVDPDGNFVVADWHGNAVWVLSATGDVIHRLEAGSPYDVTLMPDGSTLCIGNWTGDVTVMSQ